MLFQGPLRTSELCALGRKDSDTKDPHSTVSSTTSCVREVTSPTTTELEENPSMETNSKMRTSNSSTPDQEFFPWPMLDPTPTEANSLSVLSRLHGKNMF